CSRRCTRLLQNPRSEPCSVVLEQTKADAGGHESGLKINFRPPVARLLKQRAGSVLTAQPARHGGQPRASYVSRTTPDNEREKREWHHQHPATQPTVGALTLDSCRYPSGSCRRSGTGRWRPTPPCWLLATGSTPTTAWVRPTWLAGERRASTQLSDISTS